MVIDICDGGEKWVIMYVSDVIDVVGSCTGSRHSCVVKSLPNPTGRSERTIW